MAQGESRAILSVRSAARWLNDLVWRAHGWRVDPHAVEETGFMALVTAARREADRNAEGPATMQLLHRVTQAYRVLFTRALKGVYIWAPDAETRGHLSSTIEHRLPM